MASVILMSVGGHESVDGQISRTVAQNEFYTASKVAKKMLLVVCQFWYYYILHLANLQADSFWALLDDAITSMECSHITVPMVYSFV